MKMVAFGNQLVYILIAGTGLMLWDHKWPIILLSVAYLAACNCHQAGLQSLLCFPWGVACSDIFDDGENYVLEKICSIYNYMAEIKWYSVEEGLLYENDQ